MSGAAIVGLHHVRADEIAIRTRPDPIPTSQPALVRALALLLDEGEGLARRPGMLACAACLVVAGRKLLEHPDALELIDDLGWHRQVRRLRALARDAAVPVTTEDLPGIDRLLHLALVGRRPRYEEVGRVLGPGEER